MRHRGVSPLDHAGLRWYRDQTVVYRLTSQILMPAALSCLARVWLEGLEYIPTEGPVLLAANHPDNLDGYLLLHLVPRTVHIAARQDAFGTGGLCAVWRRLGAFPADSWGLRYALTLLGEGRVVATFPQATISRDLGGAASGAVGLLALRSGAPVVPVAIRGTDAVRMARPFVRRAEIEVRFGPPLWFARGGPGARTSLTAANEILRAVDTLLCRDRHAPPSWRDDGVFNP